MALCVPAKIERFNNASERDPLKCGICYETIAREDYKKLNIWTHVGGDNHDPMHKSCLKKWVLTSLYSRNQPRCPFDFCALDVSSLTSRAERVFQNLKPCLVDGAFAAVTGLMAGAAGVAVAGARAVGVGFTGAALVAAAAGGAVAGVPEAAAAAGAAGAAEVAVAVAGAGAGVIAEVAGAALLEAGAAVVGNAALKAGVVVMASLAGTAAVATAAAGVGAVAAVAAVGAVVGGAALEVGAVPVVGVGAALAVTLAGTAAAGAVTVSVVKTLFNRIVGSEANRENVMMGLYIGAFALIYNQSSGYPTTLLTISLVSGIAAGCITAYRRFVAH